MSAVVLCPSNCVNIGGLEIGWASGRERCKVRAELVALGCNEQLSEFHCMETALVLDSMLILTLRLPN
jgi:hypothetical protein